MVAHNCHGIKPKTSRQNHKPHGKTKNVTAKPKTSRQNQKPQGKNKIPHGKTKNLTAKTKYLTAKPNTSQQKQNSFGFALGICTVAHKGHYKKTYYCRFAVLFSYLQYFPLLKPKFFLLTLIFFKKLRFFKTQVFFKLRFL